MLLAALMMLADAPSGVAGEAARGVQAQVAAWNRGDLEGALAAYCPERRITWVNRGGVTRGFDEFAASMRQDFSDRGSMGRSEAELLETRPVGRRSALVVLRWSITRDGRRLMGGVSTQLWERCRGRLRITLEHAS
ncbi:MAG TPA: nuclear transport factor 2 family protein [Allosphingosinicella sp.]|jgi:hypothetical protein